MNNKDRPHAFDANCKRLTPIIERLKQAGTRNVQNSCLRIQSLPFHERFDHVLVDVRCTSIGTWRQRPDTK